MRNHIWYCKMKKKVEYTKSVVIASLVVSMALFLFGIYLIIKGGDKIQAILMIFLGLVTGLKEWINLFKKKKWKNYQLGLKLLLLSFASLLHLNLVMHLWIGF